MKIYNFLLLAFFTVFVSCKDDETERLQANTKDTQKNEAIFETIDKAWIFNTPPPNATVQNRIQGWAEWRLFMTELQQKPKSSIGAFKQKAKTLSLKVSDLQNNIPPVFNKPEVISRIMTLTTKVKSLELYINLSYIQDQKVLKLIPEINEELLSLQSQMEEIVKKSEIKLEDGEAEMLRNISDSLKKPEVKLVPMDLQNQKPSNTRGNGGILPNSNPKQNR